MDAPARIKIKGIREGLLVTVNDGSWPEVHKALLEHLDEQGEFLRGARLALDVGNHVLRAADVGQLRNHIAERDLTLWAILSNSPVTIQTAQSFGLATTIARHRPERVVSDVDTTLNDGEQAILVHRTLRSGYSLQHTGHVVVIGDVNPGAEIIAGGNVVVWGRLRGTVHAGAQGNTEAVVCALDLSPTQLRIAGHIAISPHRRGKALPETAKLLNDQVVAEPWAIKRGK